VGEPACWPVSISERIRRGFSGGACPVLEELARVVSACAFQDALNDQPCGPRLTRTFAFASARPIQEFTRKVCP
jgi:hypothetical protein